MNILAIKTDSENGELYLLKDDNLVDSYIWQAGKSLARDLNNKTREFLEKSDLSINEIDGYLAYLGPGSFTGLRIGISSMNTFAYANNKPIVGMSSNNWLNIGAERLINGENDRVLIPHYGGEANITTPKK